MIPEDPSSSLHIQPSREEDPKSDAERFWEKIASNKTFMKVMDKLKTFKLYWINSEVQAICFI